MTSTPPAFVAPQDDPRACALAWSAKVTCSGVFLSGREPQEVLQNSATWMLLEREQLRRAIAGDTEALRLGITAEVDATRRQVTVRRDDGSHATARLMGDQGAVLVAAPDGADPFVPTPIERKPANENALPAAGASVSLDTLDPSVAERAAEIVFEKRLHCASAFVVLHRGQLVCERYARGFDRNTPLEGWSMGKSVGALLAGRAMMLGGPSLDDAALFPEWENDARSDIRLRDLLQLSSGLEFSGSFGKGEDQSELHRDGHFLDHIYVYAGGIDAYAFCSGKPLEHAPGSVGRYRNCDPLLVQRAIRDWLRRGGDDPLTWPQRALFDPLGIAGIVLETDPFGGFLISGHDYGRALDFARLGQLILNGGIWNGQRLLPEGFAEFLRTPAPAWKGERGASLVLNTDSQLTLPTDAAWMSGATVNRTIIVPSLDLVVVKLGHIAGRPFGEAQALNEALGLLWKAAS